MAFPSSGRWPPVFTRRQFGSLGVSMLAGVPIASSRAATGLTQGPRLLQVLHQRRQVTTLTRGGDGAVYGTALQGRSGSLAFRLDDPGGLQVLRQFDGPRGSRQVGLSWDGRAAFWGLSFRDGAHGEGTLYRLTPSGHVHHLHDFQSGADSGGDPSGPLVRSRADGHFYGGAWRGGPANAGGLFRLEAGGRLEWLHFFDPALNEGIAPCGPLAEGPDGQWYGCTLGGGRRGHGTLFVLTRSGRLRTLHHFDRRGTDGYQPSTGLTLASDGHLYGVAPGHRLNRRGLIFRLAPEGPLEVVHDFPPPDRQGGRAPGQTLLPGRDGALYGSTQQGGVHDAGTLFRFGMDGSFTRLHAFSPTEPLGWWPSCALLEQADGVFLGATASGAAGDCGALFALSVA